jgi:hypothetical protein
MQKEKKLKFFAECLVWHSTKMVFAECQIPGTQQSNYKKNFVTVG